MRSKAPVVALLVLAVFAGLILLSRAGIIRLPGATPSVEAEIDHRRWRHKAIYRLGLDLPGTPNLDDMQGRLQRQGFKLGAPVLVRIFKREFELELWLQKDGRFERFASYPVCRFSGGLGPKIKTGDRQAPEGFYTVDAKALNPQSRWHRSFNLGFPNAFDKAHGRTGSFLMVHGGCSSAGCYAMTNAVIDEIWALVGAALQHGQARFQVQVYPFRLTDEALSDARLPDLGGERDLDFWRQLKAGYDLFEVERVPPRVRVCRGRYVVEPAGAVRDGSAPIDAACPTQKAAKT